MRVCVVVVCGTTRRYTGAVPTGGRPVDTGHNQSTPRHACTPLRSGRPSPRPAGTHVSGDCRFWHLVSGGRWYAAPLVCRATAPRLPHTLSLSTGAISGPRRSCHLLHALDACASGLRLSTVQGKNSSQSYSENFSCGCRYKPTPTSTLTYTWRLAHNCPVPAFLMGNPTGSPPSAPVCRITKPGGGDWRFGTLVSHVPRAAARPLPRAAIQDAPCAACRAGQRVLEWPAGRGGA